METSQECGDFEIDPVTALLVLVVACSTLVDAGVVPTHTFHQDDAFWFNACGHHSVHQPRHGGHKLKHHCQDLGDAVPKNSRIKVKQQLKLFMLSFRKELKGINNTYSQVMQSFTPYSQPAYEWLPKFKKPAVANKKVLQQFHLDLQKYAVAVHFLSTRELSTDIVFEQQPKRKKQLIELLNHMKSLLCEVETAVNETCQEVPTRVPASLARDEGLIDLASSLTELKVVDWGVLTRFNTFIKQSRKYLHEFLSLKKESNSDESEWDMEESATPSAEADG